VDLILAVGGGSVIDSAKAIAMGVCYEGDVWDMYEKGVQCQKALPVVTVLTIPAAGSEASGDTVITNEEKQLKYGYGSNHLRPLMSFMNPELFYTLRVLSQGLGITVTLFLIVIFISMPLGLATTFMSNSQLHIRVGRFRLYFVRWIARGYVFLMRGTPLMLQLLFVYFGLPYIPIVGQYLTFERFPAACIAFTLNYAAYFCEIFRGGIKSIDPGQYEAAQVLGLSRGQTVLKIVIPQMIKVAIPSICNEAINLVKDSALVTTLGVTDLMHMTKAQVNSLANVAPFGVAAVIYMVIIFGLSQLFARLEKKTNY